MTCRLVLLPVKGWLGRLSRTVAALAMAATVLSSASLASANCSAVPVRIWPETQVELSTTPQFVVAGPIRRMERLSARSSQLVLADGRSIGLTATLQRGYNLAQVILHADQPVPPGARVRLRLPGRYGHRGKYWRVSTREHPEPRWLSTPTAGATRSAALGCGPAASVATAVDYQATGPVRLRVRLWRPPASNQVHTSRTVQIFDIPMSGRTTEINVGHDMCAGAFAPPLGPEIRYTLALVDSSGHEFPAPGAPLVARFSDPSAAIVPAGVEAAEEGGGGG